MINIRIKQFDKDTILMEIDGLTGDFEYRTCTLSNGCNALATKDASGLFSALIHIDDITFTTPAGNSYTFNSKDYIYTLTNDEIKEFKILPFAHQLEGINYCLHTKHVLLLDSMGLG